MVEEKKYYLTKEGLQKIKKDLKNLEKIRRSKIKGEAPNILHSEEINPEYLSFWEDTDFLETRIAELKYIMKNFELIKPPPKTKQNVIDLGATVFIEAADEKFKFRIVGSLEADPSWGKISVNSPVGKALLGCRVGDVITVKSSIPVTYKILKVKYQPD